MRSLKRIGKKQKLEFNLKLTLKSIRSLYTDILLKNRLEERLRSGGVAAYAGA